MNRIIVVGEGYLAGKAAGLAGRIHPKADVVWLSDYSGEKYSLDELGLLLRSGAELEKWPSLGARLRVGFEMYQQDMNLVPQKVKRISINADESEISFLTGMGRMSYSFDKVFVFPRKIVEYQGNLQENHYVWPAQDSVIHLVDSWKSLADPVVVGSDLSLVQALVCSGKKFTWLRTGSDFSEQVQLFLDRYLKGLGVRIILPDHGEDPWTALKKSIGPDLDSRPVFVCGTCRMDFKKIEEYGINVHRPDPEVSLAMEENKVVLIDDCGPDGIHCPGAGPEAHLARCLDLVRSALTEQEPGPSSQGAALWNMGRMSATRAGLDVSRAEESGLTPEFALVHGVHGIFRDKNYVLRMVMDKASGKILGIEAVGEKAHEWANLALCLLREGSTVEDAASLPLAWPDPDLNPFVRCARMLKNKNSPGILGITPHELSQSARQGAEFFLLDVRKPQEFALGRIPGASHIPLGQLKKRVMEIPRFTPIVIYSECSGRAYDAARVLKGLGARQLYVLDGGYGLYTLDRDLSPLPPEQPGIAGTCPVC